MHRISHHLKNETNNEDSFKVFRRIKGAAVAAKEQLLMIIRGVDKVMRNDMNEQSREEHSDILTKEEIDELLKRLEELEKQS